MIVHVRDRTRNSPSTVECYVSYSRTPEIRDVMHAIPRRHGSYTHLARPLLSACVKGGWGQDYYSY